MPLKTYKPLRLNVGISRQSPSYLANMDDQQLLDHYRAFGRSDSCGNRTERLMIAEVEAELKQRKLLRA